MRLNYVGRRTVVAMAVIALLALMLSLRGALALSGSEFTAMCSNEKKVEYCLGYVMGADDALSRFSCAATGGWTASQTVKVISKFMADNPARLNEKASDLILEAFIGACKK